MGWMKIDELKDSCNIKNLKSIDNGGKAYKMSILMTQMSISYCRVCRKVLGTKAGEMEPMVKAYLPIAFHIRITK